MQNELFTVKYITVNNCFVYLPDHWLRKLSSRTNCLKLQHGNLQYYMSWNPRPSAAESSVLCLGATFARTLKIKEGDQMFASWVEEAPTLTSLVVAPKTEDDRRILELQSDNVQANLLNQISIVAKDQTIVAWVSKFLSVTLVVKSLEPEFKYGKLTENSEVYVGDALPKAAAAAPAVGASSPSSKSHSSSSLLPVGPAPAFDLGRVYRAHPFPDNGEGRAPFLAYVGRLQLPGEAEGTRLYRVRKVREDRQHVKSSAPIKFLKDGSKEFTILVGPLEEYTKTLYDDSAKRHFTTFSRHPCIFMSSDLMENLRVKSGGKVILETIASNEPRRAEVECSSIEISGEVSEELFRSYVGRRSVLDRMLLNSDSYVTLDNGSQCLVRLSPEECNYGFFGEREVRRLDVTLREGANEPRELPFELEETPVTGISLEILEPILTECKNVLKLSLGLHDIADFHYNRENILITGPVGSGKTTICKLLKQAFKEAPYFIHTTFIDCKFLKGKKVDVIQKLLATEISEAVYYQPSILFFDDIESVTSAGTSTDEVTPDSTNAARITDVIYNMVKEYQATNYISMVATSLDMNKIGKKLRDARGIHFFRTILAIPPLEKEERIKILRSSLQDKLYVAKEIDWDHYGNKTEGWVAQDLVVLADKAAFAAWKRHAKENIPSSPMLKTDDLESTISQCRPASLHGINLYKGAGHGWSDIGGLSSVKLALVEILDWPLRYPGIFKSAPIKLQSGVLLYGMPGTGKTMLAGAIAKECGVNLISVKGPELLSKYIGASEESVRNIFEKAQRAKPCVLFFDEFDSLAPRRGHDSTGVTDRVVNQLLTHLDGIEGRDGVAIVAASSRPDLLDPALLRPGRLDRSLLCTLPDQDDRVDILEALCRTHEIDTEDLDLKAVATLTSGFTGADLNAILMQTRLNAIEEALENSTTKTKQNCDGKKITQKQLMESVNLAKPSVTLSEKQKYQRIYAKFTKSEGYTADEFKRQKATLA